MDSKDLKVKRHSPKRKMDLNKALILRSKGMSYTDIAHKVGVSNHSVVSKGIKNFLASLPSNEQLKELERLKIPILKATMSKMVVGLNDQDKMKAASLNNVAYAFTQVHTALRLEEGKSTSNVSYADSLKALKDAKEELRKLNESGPPAASIPPVVVSDPEYTIPIIMQS